MNNNKKPSYTSESDGLFIPNRQLSMFIAGAIAILFCVFMGGYFVGKNHMMEPLMVRVEQSSFADQVYTSLYARYDHDDDAYIEDMKESDETIAMEVAMEEESSACSVQEPVVPQKTWYAPLIGFGHTQKKLADTFARKWQQRGMAVHVKEHMSITAQGKKKYWYQVVTDPCNNRATLQTMIDTIARAEKLKNVDIKEVKA